MTALRILATTLCLLVSGPACLLTSTAACAEDPLPRTKPEDVGFSSERLARIGAVLKTDIATDAFPARSSRSPGTASW